MVRPTFIDLDPVELKNYPFMISLDKCNWSCTVLAPKISAPKETKDINVKAFNVITNKNEAKSMTKHISCDWKCKFNRTTCNSNQNGIIKHVSVNVKVISARKIIVGILAHTFVRIAKI